jgi:predicted  nucleic acid-binding Zn-ribbon protein
VLIKSIYIRDGLFERNISFGTNANLIYSEKNSCGKTTLVRFILYALGYSIPSTKKIKFEKCFVKVQLVLDNRKCVYLTRESNSTISFVCDNEEKIYVLPEQIRELHSKIFNTENEEILNNLLGTFYFDQEKGWTLLNRGVVIGSIHFNIDELVRGISGKDCSGLILKEKRLVADLSKYKQMFSIAQYRDSINEDSLIDDTYQEKTDIELEQLRMKQSSIRREISRVNQSISGNKKFQEFVADMKLLVRTDEGQCITVTKDNIVGLNDAIDLLVAKKKILSCELAEVVSKMEKILREREKENGQLSFFESESVATAFDKRIVSIPMNQIVIKKEIEKIEKELKSVRDEIAKISRSDNVVVSSLYQTIVKYAKELGIGDAESITKKYLFTSNLKELTGAVLHKTVFAFKMAYIVELEKHLKIKLPIILDSPRGKEIDQENIDLMMNILKRDFSENQIIIASIYYYSFPEIHEIKLKENLIDQLVGDKENI